MRKKRESTSFPFPLRPSAPYYLRNSPDDIRTLGWSVAVHNDYKLKGESYTFWLFTKGSRCVKGEGRSDADAVRNQLRRQR